MCSYKDFMGRSSLDQLRELAKGFYAATWALTDDFEKARFLLDDHLHTIGLDDMHEAVSAAGGSAQVALVTEYCVLSRWPEFGFPHVVLGPQRMAEMALTRITKETTEGITLPWPSVYVALPPGLEVYSPDTDQMETIDRLSILMHRAHDQDPARQTLGIETGTMLFSWVGSTVNGLTICRGCALPEHFADPFEGKGEDGFLDYAIDDQDERVMGALDRIVVGLCLYMDDPDILEGAKKRATGKTARKKRRRFPHGVENYVLSDNVAIDAREVLSQYVSHGGKSPMVRSFVRPHWQRYRTGKGRTETVLKHRAGFFRGPKNAPMRAHKHRIPEPQKRDN